MSYIDPDVDYVDLSDTADDFRQTADLLLNDATMWPYASEGITSKDWQTLAAQAIMRNLEEHAGVGASVGMLDEFSRTQVVVETSIIIERALVREALDHLEAPAPPSKIAEDVELTSVLEGELATQYFYHLDPDEIAIRDEVETIPSTETIDAE